MDEFISEDDLKSFEGWLRYQAIDATAITPEELATWRRIFEEARQRSAMNPKVGLMKLQPAPGEYRYAVAVRDLRRPPTHTLGKAFTEGRVFHHAPAR